MNPFNIIFVITAFMLIVSGIGAAVAPQLGISTPAPPIAPTVPTFTPQTGWLEQITGYLSFVGGVLVYAIYFVGYMILLSSSLISFLTMGVIPSSVSGGLIVLVGVLFFGSLIMLVRGNANGGSK
jgi:hypothetical protein